jgi:hypothetical protein
MEARRRERQIKDWKSRAYMLRKLGIAQLGERCVRIAEVGGSNPPISTSPTVFLIYILCRFGIVPVKKAEIRSAEAR